MPLRSRSAYATIPEAQAGLIGLVAQNLEQLRQGVPAISGALRAKRLRYIRHDPEEAWLSLRDLWRRGGGDCEDLAAAVAAELIAQGIPARVVIRPVRPGLWHAQVYRADNRTILDPSITGGMRGAG